MQVSRGRVVFVCQGETFKTKKHQWLLELWGILPLYYWYVWNSFGPKKDWIFCARFSPEPGLPHWAQANNPRNWGSQRCPKIHWRHRSAFKSHKCKRPKLSCCVEVIECPILYVDQMWGLTNSLQDSVCWVCEPDGGGWWFISRDEHGRLEARWLLAIPTWSTQVGFHHWKLHFISISYNL